jgi:hypothetical protein
VTEDIFLRLAEMHKRIWRRGNSNADGMWKAYLDQQGITEQQWQAELNRLIEAGAKRLA